MDNLRTTAGTKGGKQSMISTEKNSVVAIPEVVRVFSTGCEILVSEINKQQQGKNELSTYQQG